MSRRLVEDARDWFVDGSDENLIRETLESLSCHDDPDRWLRRLALLRERLVSERKQALYEKEQAWGTTTLDALSRRELDV